MNRTEKNISEIKNRSISVIGLGQSGTAIAHLAKYLGANVFISDKSSSKSICEPKGESHMGPKLTHT